MCSVKREKQTLGLVLGANPSAAEMRVALRLASAAVDKGVGVKIFLIGDSLGIAIETKSNKPMFKHFRSILASGAEVILCSVMLRDRGCPAENISPGVVQGSLLYFSEMTDSCDRLIYLG